MLYGVRLSFHSINKRLRAYYGGGGGGGLDDISSHCYPEYFATVVHQHTWLDRDWWCKVFDREQHHCKDHVRACDRF